MIRPRETYRDIRRYTQVVRVLGRHGFKDLLDRLRARYKVTKQTSASKGLSTAERLRLAFEELGPTFIKLAQVLSSRPDMFPPEFIKELSKLQDQVPPFPFENVRQILEFELGQPPTEVFAAIEEDSIAAASLAQVHRARTKDGREIAIKIQRPGIPEIIETDIRILHEFAGLAERHIPESRYFEPVRFVEEFARTIRREMDFVREAHNIERFHSLFQDNTYIHIPKVHWELTTSKVLTTEFVNGIKISDIDKLDAAGLNRKVIAANGANLTLKEVFEFHFFHADPHPGNIFVLDNNVIAPVDFGMTGIISEDVADHMSAIFVSIVDKDISTLVAELRKIGIVEDLDNSKDFKADVRDLVERYYGVPLKRLQMGPVLKEVMSIIRQYKIHLPADFAMIARTLLISEGVGRTLDPDFNLIDTARPYARRLMLRRFNPVKRMRDLSRAANDMFAFIRSLPVDMQAILSMILNGKLAIRFEHKGLNNLIDELDRSSNRISFALVIAALIVGSSLIFQTGIGPTLFGYPIVGLVGFLLASILGIWLLIAIMRSGRL
ncbi:MAG TPA: AarF/ABC1/UbiB kinase family protein [Syntrophorhabdaceae bacterium]|nr:AarF/ABC1/UbiB kinase family protein [Syntrophorhabdaceae bacterium]